MASTALALLALALGQGAAPQPTLLSPRTPEELAAWTLSLGEEFAGAAGDLTYRDGGTLALTYDFSGGGAYVATYRKLDTPMPVGEIRFRAKKPAEARVALRVTDAEGQTFQKSVSTYQGVWQAFAADMTGWDVSWGGKGDGILHQPVTQIGLVIDHVGLREPKGELLLADVSVVPGEPGQVETAYEGAYLVTDFGPGSGWWPNGISSLDGRVWTADFARGEAAALDHSISLFGDPRELSLTVKGGAPGSILSLRLGSHFETFGRRLGVLDGGGQTFTVPAPPEGWEFWGGENDGRVYPPLRVVTVVWERGEAPAEASELTLTALRCTTALPRHRAALLHATCEGQAADDGTVDLVATCAVWNTLPEEVSATLSLTVRDWEGAVVAEESRPVTLAGGGARTVVPMTGRIAAGTNYAECEFRLAAEGLRPAPATACWVRPLADAGSPEPNPDSMWGMGVYLYRYGGDEGGLAQMDKAAAMAQAAGVKWTREEFQWNRMEPAKGQYDWTFYDKLVETAERHGISVYGLLAYWSGWTKPYSLEGIDDYCRWAGAVVSRYKGRVKHWEVWNEPNIFFWSGPKELYPTLLAKAYRAIKQADPEAVVLGCSTAGIDLGFIKRCIDAGSPFDAVTVHPYRPDLADQAFIEELRRTAEVAENRRVWITEMGWPTQLNGGTSERRQAELLARSYLCAGASGVCDNMGWYDFRSDGPDPFYNEHNFGVLRNDLAPKPAYRALAAVCGTFADGRPVQVEGLADGLMGLGSDSAMALWTTGTGGQLECTVAEGPVTVRNLMGEVVATGNTGERLSLSVSQAPLFAMGGALELGGKLTSPTGADAPPSVVRF